MLFYQRSQQFKVANTKLSKLLELVIGTTPMNQFLLRIFFKRKEKPAKTNFMTGKLHAVKVSTESESALC